VATAITAPPQLQSISHPDELARALGVDYAKGLVYYLYRQTGARSYTTFYINKRSGGQRRIDIPATKVGLLQRRLLPLLEEIYQPKRAAHGFIKSRGILTGANPHKRQRYVSRLDIQDFFESINFGRVRGLLMAKPYLLHPNIATIVAQICCHDNALPQGACTSPIIANMICAKLDSELTRLARTVRCYVTRYADDITFSCGSRRFPDEIGKFEFSAGEERFVLSEHIQSIINSNGFLNNQSKTRFYRQSDRQMVTGLVVNRKLNVDRKFVRNVRSALRAWEKYGYTAANSTYLEKFNTRQRSPALPGGSLDLCLKGRITYIGSVKGWSDPVYMGLRARFNALSNSQIRKSGPSASSDLEKSVWVIEDEHDINQGTAFYLEGYGFVTNSHSLGTSPILYHPLAPSKRYPATVRANSIDYDLAVLDLPMDATLPKPLKATFAEDAVIVADQIRVVGYPNFAPGKTISVVPGSITSKIVKSGRPHLLVSAIIQSGNSGGPVIDAHDKVIGIAVTGVPSIEHPEIEKYDMTVIPVRSLYNIIL